MAPGADAEFGEQLPSFVLAGFEAEYQAVATSRLLNPAATSLATASSWQVKCGGWSWFGWVIPRARSSRSQRSNSTHRTLAFSSIEGSP